MPSKTKCAVQCQRTSNNSVLKPSNKAHSVEVYFFQYWCPRKHADILQVCISEYALKADWDKFSKQCLEYHATNNASQSWCKWLVALEHSLASNEWSRTISDAWLVLWAWWKNSFFFKYSIFPWLDCFDRCLGSIFDWS